MDSTLENKVKEMTRSAKDVFIELEKVSEGDAAVEDIEGAKAIVAGWLDQYDQSIQRLKSEEKKNFEMELKPVVKQIKEKLVLLKEAPE